VLRVLPVVELGADKLEPAPGDAVGAAIRRGNRFLAPQLPKQLQVEARIAPAVAGQALDRGDLLDKVPGKTTKAAAARHRGHRVSGFSALPLAYEV
jgi:hypothetical protein